MPRPGRTLVVGDVHGCVAELRALLDVVDFDGARDNLVFVGDLVNKGPSSLAVVRLARELGALGVRGNHDERALKHWRNWRRAHGVSGSEGADGAPARARVLAPRVCSWHCASARAAC